MKAVPLPELDPSKSRARDAQQKKRRKRARTRHGDSSSSDDDDDDDDSWRGGESIFPEADYSWRADARYPEPRAPFPSDWSSEEQPLELFVWDIKTHSQIENRAYGEEAATEQVVRIFGLTEEEGHTVVLDVRGFRPYFYCLPPAALAERLSLDEAAGRRLCAQLQRQFEAHLRQSARDEERSGKRKRFGRACAPDVSVRLERRRNIYTFYPPTAAEIEANRRANSGQSKSEAEDDGGHREIVLRVEAGSADEADQLLRAVNRVDRQGAKLEEGGLFCDLPPVTFEGQTLQHADKLLNDLGIVGCGWVRVPSGRYAIRRDVPLRQLVESLRATTCSNLYANGFFRNRPLCVQAVASCHVAHLEPLPDKQSFPSRMRVLSFDLETTTLGKQDDRLWSEPLDLDTSLYPDDAVADDQLPPGESAAATGPSLDQEAALPDPNYRQNREDHAAIIQISAVLYEFPAGRIVHKAIFSLGSLLKTQLQQQTQGEQANQEENIAISAFCFGEDPGDREGFREQDEEERMLRAFTEYLAVADPDLITGYNILGFDWDYLVGRYQKYNLPPLLSRSGCPVTVREDNFESRAFGARKYQRPRLDGRISMDMRVEVERGTQKKLRSYTLNAVCEAHLRGQTKLVRRQCLCGGGGGGGGETGPSGLTFCVVRLVAFRRRGCGLTSSLFLRVSWMSCFRLRFSSGAAAGLPVRAAPLLLPPPPDLVWLGVSGGGGGGGCGCAVAIISRAEANGWKAFVSASIRLATTLFVLCVSSSLLLSWSTRSSDDGSSLGLSNHSQWPQWAQRHCVISLLLALLLAIRRGTFLLLSSTAAPHPSKMLAIELWRLAVAFLDEAREATAFLRLPAARFALLLLLQQQSMNGPRWAMSRKPPFFSLYSVLTSALHLWHVGKWSGFCSCFELLVVGLILVVILDPTQCKREFKLTWPRAYLFSSHTQQDVHFTNIPRFWRGSIEQRTMLARYCVKDAVLPLLLLDKLKLLYNNVALSRATGLVLQRLLDRGQSLRAFNAIRSEAFRRGWLVPDRLRDYTAPPSDGLSRREKKGYTGAVVIEPVPGYYQDDWTLTYDFSSLYPSIIIAYATCYTTLVPKAWVPAMQAAGYAQPPDSNGNVFLRREIRAGIVATCVRKFLVDRAKAKALMNRAHGDGDKLLESIYNALQNALKLCANGNSRVSFVVSVGWLTKENRNLRLPRPDQRQAAQRRVRGLGDRPRARAHHADQAAHRGPAAREELARRPRHLRRHRYEPPHFYPRATRSSGNPLFLLPDSVMVKMDLPRDIDVKEVMRRGTIGEEIINSHFRPLEHLKVVLEKGFKPFLLVSKKRYAGWKFVVDPSAPGGIGESLHISGLEAVRRDNPVVLNESVNAILRQLCSKTPDKEEATRIACRVVEQILMRQLPVAKMVETKGLTKVAYKSVMPHVVVNEKKKQREGESAAYRLGERIPFVIVDGPGLTAKRAEDPPYAEMHNLPLATQYYLDRLSTPYTHLFDSVYHEGYTRRHIFNGPHTRRKKVPGLRPGGDPGSRGTLAAFGFFSKST